MLFKKLLPMVVIAALLLAVGCSGGSSLSDKIVGKWKINIDETAEKMSDKDKKVIAMVKKMFENVRIEFTGTEVKASVMGKEQKEAYTIVSQEGNVLHLKSKDEMVIEFITDTKILLYEKDKKGKFKFVLDKM